MNTRGIGVPVVIERFSTVRHRRGWSDFERSSTAPDIESACLSAVKYWNSAYAVAMTSVTMTIVRSL